MYLWAIEHRGRITLGTMKLVTDSAGLLKHTRAIVEGSYKALGMRPHEQIVDWCVHGVSIWKFDDQGLNPTRVKRADWPFDIYKETEDLK